MPRGRPRNPKRKFAKRGKWKRKIMNKGLGPIVNKCYCKRFVVKATIGGSDLTPANGQAFKWNLSDTPSTTDFTNMFDQYCIAGVAYRFVLNKDDNSQTTAANRGSFIRIMAVNDFNDATAPTSFAELQQYPYVKEIWLNESRPTSKWYYQKPSVLNTINSLVANNYNPRKNTWIDTGYPGTDHYGLKIFYDQHFAGRTIFVEAKYYIKLKEIR